MVIDLCVHVYIYILVVTVFVAKHTMLFVRPMVEVLLLHGLQAGHKFPVILSTAIGGSLLSYIYIFCPTFEGLFSISHVLVPC